MLVKHLCLRKLGVVFAPNLLTLLDVDFGFQDEALVLFGVVATSLNGSFFVIYHVYYGHQKRLDSATDFPLESPTFYYLHNFTKLLEAELFEMANFLT